MSPVSPPVSNLKQRHLDPAGYLSNKTIVAICSPTGGAISALRISGADAHAIFEKWTGVKPTSGHERRATRHWLKNSEGEVMDDAVCIPYFEPRSFTGEHVVEVFFHGSPIIAQKLIDSAVSLGARTALPGEFSFRAVKNGKMQLSQAEAVKELIAAENDFSLSLALEKLSGTQHEFIEKIRADLMQLVTLAEAGIDFSDQDLDEVSLPTLKKRAHSVSELLSRLGGSFDRGKRFLDGIPVALIGLPNAGKSSFFNALLGEDRSIVSDIAGTTRDVVREKLNLKTNVGDQPGATVTFRLADTAGIRKSNDVIEGIGIERSVKSAAEADLIVFVVDGTNPSFNEAAEVLSKIDKSEKEVLTVVTKKDQVSVDQMGTLLSEAKKKLSKAFAVSSTTLEGVEAVAAEMAKAGASQMKRRPGEVVLTQFEQVQAVKRALEALKMADQTTDIVLFATKVRHSMNELGPLLGETIADDVLGKIFSDFCIGK